MFEPVGKKERKELEQMQKESAERIKITQGIAKKCLGNEDFVKYRKDFYAARAKILDEMIRYTKLFFLEKNGDMAMYGTQMARYLTKIEDLGLLLDTVERNAR